jgi:hypothetical protein
MSPYGRGLSRAKRSRETIGTQTYEDCHIRNSPDENRLVVSTWANHVDFTVVEVKAPGRREPLRLGADLDPETVDRVIEQLTEWRDSRS